MEIILTTTPASELETGALVALAFCKAKNGDKNGEIKPADTPPETSIDGLDAAVGGWVSEVYAAREFTGKALEFSVAEHGAIHIQGLDRTAHPADTVVMIRTETAN